MQTSRFALILAALTSAFACLLLAPSVSAQGSLLPPGPPGATMKTLDQIEARIPLVDGLHGTTINATTHTITITQPGSYYLTDNVLILPGGSVHGVIIDSPFVTLDLNGFTINSTVSPAAGSAIALAPVEPGSVVCHSNITIKNGFLRSGANASIYGGPVTAGAGFFAGVYSTNLYQPSTSAVLVENLTISGINGTAIAGVDVVRNCVIDKCLYGVSLCNVIESCRLTNIQGSGITNAELVRSTQVYVKDGDAVYASIIVDSYASTAGGNGAVGIYCLGVATNCIGHSEGPGGSGMVVSVANNCTASASGGVGVPNGNSTSAGAPIALRALEGAYNCSASADSGVAIRSPLAVGCTVRAGTTEITNKYNMP